MNDDRLEVLRQRLIRARIEAGLERKDLAEALSVADNTYGHYERGRTPLTVSQLFVISRRVGRSVCWLLGIEHALTQREDELLTRFRTLDDSGKAAVIGLAKVLEGK